MLWRNNNILILKGLYKACQTTHCFVPGDTIENCFGLGFGTGAAYVDGIAHLSLTYRDAAALPWLDTDNLADRSRTYFDPKANPLKTVLPDDNIIQEQFDPTFNE